MYDERKITLPEGEAYENEKDFIRNRILSGIYVL